MNAVSDGRLTPEGSARLSTCDESNSHVDTLLPKIDWDTLAESLGGGGSKLPQILNQSNQSRNVRFILFLKLKVATFGISS